MTNTNINAIAKIMNNGEISRLSYVYKCIRFGGSTEEEIIAANGPEYGLSFGGKHISLEEAGTILRFYDLMDDMSYRK
jgi:hypothetical protein